MSDVGLAISATLMIVCAVMWVREKLHERQLCEKMAALDAEHCENLRRLHESVAREQTVAYDDGTTTTRRTTEAWRPKP